MHSNEDANKSVEQSLDELSDTWRKLLGSHLSEEGAGAEKGTASPSLTNDPWSQLLHARGVEIVDLQQQHLHEIQISLSELEVEDALQIMQEHPLEGKSQG